MFCAIIMGHKGSKSKKHNKQNAQFKSTFHISCTKYLNAEAPDFWKSTAVLTSIKGKTSYPSVSQRSALIYICAKEKKCLGNKR